MSIDFSGSFTITPPLNLKQYAALKAFAKERHEGSSFPDIWCDWVPNETGDKLEWSGSEKFRSAEEWLVFLIGTFLDPWGLTVNGRVLEQDHEYCETRTIIVDSNTVSSMSGDHT